MKRQTEHKDSAPQASPAAGLRPRQKALLAALIERYIQTAEPVGSATLSQDVRVAEAFGPLSSATIRNDLAELEGAGMLAHPHTSAGRIPTDRGYRFYVDEILRPRPVSPRERAQIRSRVAAPPTSVQVAVQEATAALASMTGYPAVASLPPARQDTMRHVQINVVPPRRLMVLLVTAAGRIEHRIFEVEQDVPSYRLNTLVRFLNNKLGGRPLQDVRDLSFDQVSQGLHEEATIALARRAWDVLRLALAELGDETVVVQGIVTLLNEPEFADIDKARAAMRMFEDAAALNDWLHWAAHPGAGEASGAQPGHQPHAIIIGREHPLGSGGALYNLSFVGIAYGTTAGNLGTVGVIGPTRMKYADAMALVPALAARLRVCLDTF